MLYINQIKYIEKLLKKFSIYNTKKPVKILGELGIKLRKNTTIASNKDIN